MQSVWLRFYTYFLLATLYLAITMGGARGESSSETTTTTTTVESKVPTLAPTPFAEDITDPQNTDGSGNYWAILGPVLGGIGIAALCAMGCYMQHREYLFELQTRRRP